MVHLTWCEEDVMFLFEEKSRRIELNVHTDWLKDVIVLENEVYLQGVTILHSVKVI